MKVRNPTVDLDDIGWHGLGDVTVRETTQTTATIDISTWVDEDGVGPSATGTSVRKQFPTCIVLLENAAFDTETFVWRADTAYVGYQGTHHQNTYTATFDDSPPATDYLAFFPHGTDTCPSDADTTDQPTPVNYTRDDVTDLLTTP